MFELITPEHFRLLFESDNKPVIIDARRRFEYNAGHIPGAVIMRWEQWCEKTPQGTNSTMQQPGWWGRLADPVISEAGRRLAEIGISNKKPVVVYADGARTKGRDGRIAWMLLYMGVESVSLLDGGWNEWILNTGVTETTDDSAEPQVVHSTIDAFDMRIEPSRRILLSELRQRLNERMGSSVDTRTVEEFAGELYDYQPRKGRLPDSVNIPFSTLYEENGRFISREKFLKLLGYHNLKNQSFFSYCEVGVRAATFSLLHELYCDRRIPLYDGSFMEWALDPDLPIESGIPPTK